MRSWRRSAPRFSPLLLTLSFAGITLLPAPAAERTLGDRRFTFPDGYTLEVAAGPDLVARPIEACFDNRGRLFVTESSGTNEPVAEQLKKKPHRVLRLEDGDGDGIFDRRTIFADRLMFPEGVLWHEGMVLVSACPEIWKFTDADDDGVADSRAVWFDGKTLTGCANDLHGPYLGPDGWIYWCKGGFADHEAAFPHRSVKTRASHVYRARPDASGVEIVMSAGMDNPVGLAWTPERELIVSGTFFQNPGGGRRDGLIHAVRGGVWGKDQDFLDALPRTGPLLDPMTHMGPAAPCGLTSYDRDLLCCQFNMRKVSRHRPEPRGSALGTVDSDFLVCDHPDFHPTDVLQAPDGSVLVIDTGGWYKLCCPTSQLAKPEVTGTIYRLRRTAGEVPAATPAPRFDVAGLADSRSSRQALCSPDLAIRRAAAEALGRMRDAEAAPDLLAAAAADDVDRFLEHSICYALIELREIPPLRSALKDGPPRVQKVALFALSEIAPDQLAAGEIIGRLSADDTGLRAAALAIARRHDGARQAIEPWLARQLEAPDAGGSATREVLSAFAGDEAIRRFLGARLGDDLPAAARTMLIDVMASVRGKRLPAEWSEPFRRLLVSAEPALAPRIIRILKTTPPADLEPFRAAIERIARDPAATAALRLDALAVATPRQLDTDQFDFVTARYRNAESSDLRAAAARVLDQSELSSEQGLVVASWLADAGPLERPLLLKIFRGCRDEAVGRAVVDALSPPGLIRSLSPELVDECLGGFPPDVLERLRVARAEADRLAGDDRSRLDRFQAVLASGEAARGSILFQSARAACATCHQIGYKGGQVGPDLTRVGAIRTPRDLLESIILPSASFVRSYEPVHLVRTDGSTVYGFIRDQGSDAVTLVTGANLPDQRVTSTEIRQLAPGPLSIMPAGYDQLFTPQEVADLVAFLASMK